MKKFIFLLMASLFLSGCWDRYDLEERANILGLAIDVIDEEAEGFTIPEITYRDQDTHAGEQKSIYKITAQLAVPGKIKLGPEGGGESTSDETSWVVQTTGFSMKDGMANLQQQLAEKLYLGHLQITIVNEDVAKKGLDDINDFLKREYEVRRTSWMVVSTGKAEDVLRAAPPIETVPALYLSDTLENAMRFGKLPREYLGKFWIDEADVGVDGALPYVRLIEQERILVDGLAYFKDDKMVGTMSPFEIGVYLGMKGENRGGYGLAVSSDDGGMYILESYKRDSDIDIKIEENVPSIKINVKIDSNIAERSNVKNITNNRVEEIEELASNIATKKYNQVIKKWQENESDVLGIGARVRAKFPKYWSEEVKTIDRWYEIYKQLNMEVKVRCEIIRTGMEYR
ncbi:Ger(x)C family spore germination protein [Ureibacillus endophyticus]|uniref:Ger(X)C family spore germination protein n=1 Tax=Ureibacillus endophyticus TaxID=1978490 RepID=A0A494ZAH5_9BACL|nr:Ger(x)C family spore germination protein [Lysinibacillus endophyticus]RKQ19620.1 Ger(x)C family spore germination protein [Lysinibacillus endophyticus]